MGTKIINISKNDGTDEVLDALNQSEAEEVIFIFPKSSAFSKKGGNFELIKQRSVERGQRLTIMTTDEKTIRLAMENDIEVVENRKEKKSKKVEAPKAWTEHEEKEKEKIDDEDSPEETMLKSGIARYALSENEEPEEPQVSLTMAKFDTQSRKKTLADIIPPKKGADRIPVHKEKSEEGSVEIITELLPNKESSDIAKIWHQRMSDRPSTRTRKEAHSFGVPKIKFGGKKIVAPAVAIGILVMIVIFYITLGSVKIVIEPEKKEFKNFALEVKAGPAISAVDTILDKIPGQKFSETKNITESFKPTGRKEVAQKAKVKITIFNTGTSSQNLVATTRFESPTGLIFRISQSLTVPAAKQTGSELVPGSVEAEIMADKAGPEYNIGPSRFTIPGFEGTPKFTQFYATSSAPAVGGIIGTADVVTEQDLINAQTVLSSKLKEELTKSLYSKISNLKSTDGISFTISEPKTSSKPGDAIDSFAITLDGSAETIAFREGDIIKLIAGKLEAGMELLEDDLKINYDNAKITAEKEEITFKATVNGSAARIIDTEKILNDILGAKEATVKEYFTNLQGIERAKINLSPFWLREVPQNKAKIQITIDK